MRRNLIATIAVLAALCLNVIAAHSAKRFDTKDYWYVFTGNQTCSDRENCNNYCCPTLTKPAACTGVTNECAVEVTVTLDAMGNPPAHPDCSCLTFNAVTCMPNGGSCFVANATKP